MKAKLPSSYFGARAAQAGEYLDRTVVTCAVVLLLSSVIIRKIRPNVA